MNRESRLTFFITRIRKDAGSVHLSQKEAKLDQGGSSLLFIRCQTAELFTATGWRILLFYKGLCKVASCNNTQPKGHEKNN